MQLSTATFHELRRAIHGLCGLVVSEEKEYLIRDRLGPLIAARGMTSFEELCRRLQAAPDEVLIEAVIDAVTTHETSFFRDPHVFQALSSELFPLLASEAAPSGRPIRLWSAGTSQGQEAYSLAMLAQELAFLRGSPGRPAAPCSVVASDISRAALRAARSGQYDARDVARGLSAARLARFFQSDGSKYIVRPEVRQLVDFRHLNLCNSLAGVGTFDLICCRNVLIYFDLATRQRICQQFQAALRDGGWLLLGTAENLYGISASFESVRLAGSLFYRKAT